MAVGFCSRLSLITSATWAPLKKVGEHKRKTCLIFEKRMIAQILKFCRVCNSKENKRFSVSQFLLKSFFFLKIDRKVQKEKKIHGQICFYWVHVILLLKENGKNEFIELNGKAWNGRNFPPASWPFTSYAL